MTSLQASMQSAQPMHSSCWPSRMSMPVGQTATHWLQSTQSPRPEKSAPFLCLAARLAAPFLVGDDQLSSSSIAAWMRGQGHM